MNEQYPRQLKSNQHLYLKKSLPLIAMEIEFAYFHNFEQEYKIIWDIWDLSSLSLICQVEILMEKNMYNTYYIRKSLISEQEFWRSVKYVFIFTKDSLSTTQLRGPAKYSINGKLVIKCCWRVRIIGILTNSGSPFSTSAPITNIIPIYSILEQWVSKWFLAYFAQRIIIKFLKWEEVEPSET